MSQPNPALAPPVPHQAAARLIEAHGVDRAYEVARGYAMARYDESDTAGELAWRRVMEAIIDWSAASAQN